jgi:hypothetical protein
MIGVACKSQPAACNIELSYADFRNMLKGKGLLQETGKKNIHR